MHLILWLAVCAAVAVGLRKRLPLLLIGTLATWIAVPAVAAAVVTGKSSGSLGMHPATWLVLVIFAVQLLDNQRAVASAISRQVLVWLGLGTVATVAVLVTKTGATGSGVVLVLDQMIAPMLLALLIWTAWHTDARATATLRTGILALAGAEAVYTLMQAALGSVLLYEHFYASLYWFPYIYGRWMGTTDHPLVLSLFMCGAIPLVSGINRVRVQVPLLVLFVVTVALTQSRAGVVAAAVGVMYVVGASRLAAGKKIAVLVLLGGAGYAIATSSLVTGVTERVANDTGSTSARTTALGYFLDNWQHYLVGQGAGASYRVADQAGLASSFESAFLMYSIDFGVGFALLYFGFQVYLVVAGARRPVLGARQAALVVLVLCQTFSALAADSLAGPLLWTLVALASLPGARTPLQTPPEATAPAEVSTPAEVPPPRRLRAYAEAPSVRTSS